MTRVDVLVIFTLAGVLALVPAFTDRWAVRRGASPETLAALAAVTLVGIAAVPATFAVCTGSLAVGDGGHGAPSVAAVAGLLLVAVGAGRTLARVLRMRGRWSALSRLAATLDLPQEPGGVRVLPVGELLAFVSGSEAFISQGLLDRLSPSQRRAVIEHEHEHVQRRHARLLGAARALTHGSLDIAPARHATTALDRELDVLADRAAAQRLGGPQPVAEALRAVAAATTDETSGHDDGTQRRIERISDRQSSPSRLVDTSVRFVTLVIGAFVLASICLAIHAGTAWLGFTACAGLVASFTWFTRPALTRSPSLRRKEIPHA
jgi:hypothetical protein